MRSSNRFTTGEQGPYIKDVRTKGGGGVSPKADIVREVVWIEYCGQGVKNPEKFADILYVWSHYTFRND